MSEQHQRLLLFVGSYAEEADPGIYVYELNQSSGELTLLDQVSGMKNPTFVNVDGPNRKLYSIAETKNMEGERIGEVISFEIDPTLGSLTECNRSLTLKPSTSHIQRDREDKYLILSGYHGGNVGLVKLNDEETVGQLTDEKLHTGHGADSVRQDRPHPHSTLCSPDNRFVLVSDLGLDIIKIYRLDQDKDQLIYHGETHTPPGCGPRHLAFHPNGRLLYSINEVNSSITAFSYDAEAGQLTEIETVSTLPTDFLDENTTAEIAISKDGLFLYGSNRGHDSIVLFTINPDTGQLTYVEHVSTEGGHPRHFALTPDGSYLIVANRDSNGLNLFKVDPLQGRLSYTGQTAHVSKPVCVQPVLFNL
ncbi:lactonase family protein [Paenibacillus anaericanus]|uniref:Lactonase family protein n=1 Tax=Paenibacillus anaericanus TaxID=170367 RepID=A0A3S1DTI0_9BACL|nr:lactonase family protein [Paenibacillus anaericanus]RUT46974.1 lactonase family protein [Paenibacillus anaericanus]